LSSTAGTISARPVAFIVAGVVFMQLLDGAIIATSLPVMARDLGVPTLSMSIGITTYLLAAAIFMPMSSWLSDQYGARQVFLAAIVGFTAVSLFCALAQDLSQFVLARILQGTGGPFMVPVGRAILELFVQQEDLVWLAVIMAAIGVIGCIAAARHLRTASSPLLSLASFGVPTFSLSTIAAGSYMRLAVDAMPFLIPLLLQVGMGYDPLQAGSLMLVYFIGNMAMKSVTTPTLRLFGFRSVLLLNGCICAATIAACGVIVPYAPVWVTVIVLGLSGLSRSMQCTGLSSAAFADIDSANKGSASTLISIVQQMNLVLAVAVATLMLKLSQGLRGGFDTTLIDLQLAIGVMALLGAVSTVLMLRLPSRAGDEIAGRAIPKQQGAQS